MGNAGDVVAERYRLIEPIGRGGFGEVWRAEQLGVGREVALKLLHRQTLDTSAVGRFRREADLARRLEHPNTVRLLDFGVSRVDTPYIVFELLRGQTLAELLKREKRLPEPRAIRIVTQILKSLMEAHALGVVHRDIKPANIVVSEHAGEPDFVKVLDFGIAKSLHSSSKFKTQTGEVVGTPAYMAPEQAAGSNVSPRWDVWAVGILLVEMLSGERVYRGDSVDILMALVSRDPAPLPKSLDQSSLLPILQRATRKNPDERPATAAEMLAELENRTFAASMAPTARISGQPPVMSSTIDATTAPIHGSAPPPALTTIPPASVGLPIAVIVVALGAGMVVVIGALALVIGLRSGQSVPVSVPSASIRQPVSEIPPPPPLPPSASIAPSAAGAPAVAKSAKPAAPARRPRFSKEPAATSATESGDQNRSGT